MRLAPACKRVAVAPCGCVVFRCCQARGGCLETDEAHELDEAEDVVDKEGGGGIGALHELVMAVMGEEFGHERVRLRGQRRSGGGKDGVREEVVFDKCVTGVGGGGNDAVLEGLLVQEDQQRRLGGG